MNSCTCCCGDPVSGFEYQRMGKIEFVEVVSNRQSVDPAGANLPEIVIGKEDAPIGESSLMRS